MRFLTTSCVINCHFQWLLFRIFLQRSISSSCSFNFLLFQAYSYCSMILHEFMYIFVIHFIFHAILGFTVPLGQTKKDKVGSGGTFKEILTFPFLLCLRTFTAGKSTKTLFLHYFGPNTKFSQKSLYFSNHFSS